LSYAASIPANAIHLSSQCDKGGLFPIAIQQDPYNNLPVDYFSYLENFCAADTGERKMDIPQPGEGDINIGKCR
jgi:hypothetical protein